MEGLTQARLVRITAPGGAFRRAGMAFSAEPATMPLFDLTGAQLVLLTNEPALRVEASMDGEVFIGLPAMTTEMAESYDQERARVAERLGVEEPAAPAAADPAAAADAVAARESAPTAAEVAAEIGADANTNVSGTEGNEAGQDGPHASAADVSEAIDPAASDEQKAAAAPSPPPPPPPAPPPPGRPRRTS